MKARFLLIACSFLSMPINSQTIILEGFDAGKTPPTGWTIKVSDVYTGSTNVGKAIPALKFGTSAQFVETDTFSQANTFSFWAKGNSTDSASKLIFECKINDIWKRFDSLSNIKTAKTYTFSLPEFTSQLRISYIKSAGNIAFDDLCIFKKTIPEPKPELPNLFFTKIIKGSGNNKVIEIFNPSMDTAFLAKYRITMSANGDGWKTTFFKFPEDAKIAPKDVFVIVKTTADSSLVPFEEADLTTTSSLLTITGNDARAIQKQKEDGTWETIDVYGNPDTSLNFEIAGIADAANKYNIYRKFIITKGNADWNQSAGTDSINSEWNLYPLNYYDNIGRYQVLKSNRLFFKTFEITGQLGATIIDTINKSILLTIPKTLDLNDLNCQYSLQEGVILKEISSVIKINEAFQLVVKSNDLSDSAIWIVTITKAEGPKVNNIRYYGITIEIEFEQEILNKVKTQCGDFRPFIRIAYGPDCENKLSYVATIDSNKLYITHEMAPFDAKQICVTVDSIYDMLGYSCEKINKEFLLSTFVKSSSKDHFKLYPNPIKNYFTITNNNSENCRFKIQIISIEGKIIRTDAQYFSGKKIDLSGMKEGFYFVKISDWNENNTLIHFIKK